MLKSKTSRWLAGPYLLWMAAFIIVPLFIVIWYALTNADGRFTLDNLTQIGRYSSVFMRSLILAAVSYRNQILDNHIIERSSIVAALFIYILAWTGNERLLYRNIARSSLMKTFMLWFAVWFFLMSVWVII